MDFGRVEEKELSGLDLSLPPDPLRTKEVLAKSKAKKPQIYAGCAKWGRPDWVGKIYPKKTKAADFLEAYAKQFNCIEFNAVFYKLPSHEQVRTWKSKVGPDFKFCPKFTDVITHLKRLKNVQHDVDVFLDVMSEFGDNLGPIFLMPHPQMSPKHIETIIAFLESVPKDLDMFVELRHVDWFKDHNLKPLLDAMQKRKFGSVITDAAGRRDCVHMELTTPDVFVRFVGNSLHPTDYTRVDEWVERIRRWMDEGLRRCYFFMHQHEELYSPELSRYLIRELNDKCGLDIHVPHFWNDDQLL